ncbi:hypothetical protein C7B61_21260 [filamentous cyanobacterium CCP1]|nr:hypothetical protein C7B76_26600 [filamentous cyanobacterium CCP2]PSB55520.1 hypothetical protein C7B61_21260 [filamentous cyanobacterium CCP1]
MYPYENDSMQPTTLLQTNKEIALHFFQETWEKCNLAAVDRLTSKDFKVSYPVLPAPLDAEGFKAWLTDIHTGFPDLRMIITDTIAEADKVVIAWQAKATQTGELKLINLPPTGRSVSYTGIIIYRIVAGKIVEERGEEDVLGLLKQLGLIP